MTKDKQGRVSRAQERKEASDKLSPKQKLEKLDSKFGEGKGAEKERSRLQKLLGGEKVQQSVKVPEELPQVALSADILAQMDEINKPSDKKSRKKK